MSLLHVMFNTMLLNQAKYDVESLLRIIDNHDMGGGDFPDDEGEIDDVEVNEEI